MSRTDTPSSDATPWLRRPVVLATVVAVVTVALSLLPAVAQVLLVIFGAMVLSVLLDGVSTWFATHTLMPRWLAFLLFVLVSFCVVVAVGWLMGDRISDQFNEISQRVEQGAQQLESQLHKNQWTRQLMSRDTGWAGPDALWSQAGGFFSSALGALANAFILVVVSLYLAASPDFYIRNLLRLAPAPRRARYAEVLAKLGETLRWWFVGRFSSMAVTGTLTGLGLWIAGVPMALALGLIAGFLSFVPFFGPLVAAIPGLLVAWIQGPGTAVAAVAVYALVQVLESNVITPLIQKRAVSVAPALLVTGQLLLGSLYGFWGVLWATPLIVAVMVVVQMLYLQDVLNEEVGSD